MPPYEPAVHGAPGRQVLGQGTPLASRAQHVKDAVENRPHSFGRGAGSMFTAHQEGTNQVPFGIRDIAWVSQTLAGILASVLCGPHRRLHNQPHSLNHNPLPNLFLRTGPSITVAIYS